MNNQIKKEFEKSKYGNNEERYESYLNILKLTEQKVDWAYEVWDQLIKDLSHEDNHQRSRAAQYLCNLAISDPEQRILNDFPKIWKVTYDEKFVTARHTLQSIWKIGLAGNEEKEMVLEYMTDRFHHCTDEKNYTLIRSDILQNMRNLYNILEDETIKLTAMKLIETVEEEKYKKKYMKIWK